MKKINFPLSIGIILLTILLLISLFPERFATKDPNFQQQFRSYTVIENGKEVHKLDLGAWGPNKDNLMGTDEMSRDIYSRIIYGARTTLKTALLVVLLRILVSIPIGVIAGIGNKYISSLIRFFNTIFTAIPTLFMAFFILNIKYITKLEVQSSIWAFAIVLTALGWGKLAKQVEEKVDKIMKEEFIEGEIAVGKSTAQIAIQNMIPHLVPSLISLVFIEVGMVIFLLAQLSIFEVVVGPRLELVRWGGATPIYFAENPEWGSMLSRILVNNRNGKYWVGLYPALAFAVGILAFNLTGEGLRIEFEKRTSRVASFIRNIGFLISPRIYFQQILRFKEYKKPIAIKSLCIVLALVYFFMPPSKSLYPFNVDSAISHIEELSSAKYEGRLTGYKGAYDSGDYIIDILKGYGLEPYDGESYYQSYSVSDRNEESYATLRNVVVEDAEIRLISQDGKEFLYNLEYFNIATIKDRDIENEELRDENGYITLKAISTPPGYKEVVQMPEGITNLIQVEEVDYGTVMNRTRNRISSMFGSSNKISFMIPEENLPKGFPTFLTDSYNFTPSGEFAEKLKTDIYQVEIKIKKINIPSYDGRNIMAVLPGKDWHEPLQRDKKREIIIIGSSYDGVGMIDDNISSVRASNASINLEIARVLSQIEEPLDKSIVFAFWDGESLYNSGSYYYNNKDRIFTQDFYKIFYFDIGEVGSEDSITTFLYTVPHFQIDTFDMNNDINAYLKKKKIKHKYDSTRSSSYRNIGSNMSLRLSVDGHGYRYKDREEDNIDNINKKALLNMGQYYIDLITMDENFR